MLNRIPGHTPPLSLMLDDLGQPSAPALAKALGVTERTVRRWLAADEAPRTVLLSIFWVTRWGRSAVDAEATNDARAAWGYLGAVKDENAALRAELARVLALADTGAANDATQLVRPLAEVIPITAAARRSSPTRTAQPAPCP